MTAAVIGPGGRGSSSVHLVVALVGAVALEWLIRPLRLRRAAKGAAIRLAEDHDPRLFAYVHRMCDAVGAPRPAAIDLTLHANAFAIPQDGWRSLLRGDVALGLGAPLVACLEVRELASIIGHELGHFRQRNGMRAYCLVHAITGWIERGTAPIDWAAARERGKSSLGMLHHRAGVWLSQTVLRLVWLVGQLPATFLARQMERDADDCAVRLVGPEAHAAAVAAFPHVARALDAALQRLGEPDTTPPADINDWVREAFAQQGGPHASTAAPSPAPSQAPWHRRWPARWLASHPSDAERIERARASGADGVRDLAAVGPHAPGSLPATNLFALWDECARAVTAVCLVQS